MKKSTIAVLSTLLVAFFLILPAASQAFSVKTGNTIIVESGETIDGNYYAAGNTINIRGTIKGDLVCAAQRLNVSGKIKGDILSAGENIRISGAVDGNIRVAGTNLDLTGTTSRNVMAFSNSLVLSKNAGVGGDMLVVGGAADISGNIQGSLHGAVREAMVSGKIGDGINLRMEERPFSGNEKTPLIITEGAIIKGNVNYTAGIKGDISDNAEISGEIIYKTPPEQGSAGMAAFRAWYGLFSLFGMLVAGLVIVSLWRNTVRKITDRMLDKTGQSFLFGILVLILTPIICLLLMLTLIGAPVAFILLTLWLIAIYLSKILTGILIGRALVEKLWQKKKDSLIWSMIAGVTIIWFISSLPLIGWIASLIAVWWGLGGVWHLLEKSISSE